MSAQDSQPHNQSYDAGLLALIVVVGALLFFATQKPPTQPAPLPIDGRNIAPDDGRNIAPDDGTINPRPLCPGPGPCPNPHRF